MKGFNNDFLINKYTRIIKIYIGNFMLFVVLAIDTTRHGTC
jgi:hypothetical protein